MQAGAKQESTPKKKDLATLDKEWEAERKKTFDSLKGKSREQLVNTYRQSSNLDLGSLKDMSMRDLKGAIVSSKHGWYSPSEMRQRIEEKRKSRETK